MTAVAERGDRAVHVVAALLALSAWFGAALLLAVAVAPAAFAVLPTRALAGALVGRVLPTLFFAGMAVGLVVAVLDLRYRGTPFRRGRLAGAGALVVSCAVAQLLVAPRIARLRDSIGSSIDALSPLDPARVAFGRLHALSVGWLAVGMVAAGVALLFTVLALRGRS